jgi:DNA polymerase-3 subunit alpha
MKDEIVGFEHLHLHTDFSVLDGYGMVEEYAKRAPQNNQQYLCISDHGALGAVPRQIKACEKNNISPLFACELYVNPNQPEVKKGEAMSDYTSGMDQDDRKKMNKSYHLLAIAFNEVGYSNLVQISSWAWTRGFYRKPRVNYDFLMKHREGIIFTSCCYMGEIGQAFDLHGEDAAFDMVEKYMEMFGENFYLEFMLLDFNKQKPYDAFIMKAHERYGVPVIVTNDCHYCMEEDSKMQRLMLMVQTGRTIKEIEKALAADQMADFFELQDQQLWMKSEEEINKKWLSDYSDVVDYEILKQAKLNTVDICERAKGVELDRSIKLPEIEDADERLRESMIEGFMHRRLPHDRRYLERLDEEYQLISAKKFSSYFLIQKMMTDEARKICPIILGFGDGKEAVGPGRGSGVSSLINYCLGVTDVDPIEHDLLFSRFLSPARGGRQMNIHFNGKPIMDEPEKVMVPGVESVEECPF